MALDYAKDRVHINAVCPGFVESPMIESITYVRVLSSWCIMWLIADFKCECSASKEGREALTSRHPWNALGRPEDVADGALFLCSDESSWMTGHPLVIDGAYTCQ